MKPFIVVAALGALLILCLSLPGCGADERAPAASAPPPPARLTVRLVQEQIGNPIAFGTVEISFFRWQITFRREGQQITGCPYPPDEAILLGTAYVIGSIGTSTGSWFVESGATDAKGEYHIALHAIETAMDQAELAVPAEIFSDNMSEAELACVRKYTVGTATAGSYSILADGPGYERTVVGVARDRLLGSDPIVIALRAS